MRAISTVSMPQRRLPRRRDAGGPRHSGCDARLKRRATSSAALVPPKPRHRISASCCAASAAAPTMDSPAQSGSSSRNVGTPGTTSSASAASASVVSRMPAAAMRCPNDHLNAVTGGGFLPKTVRIAAASDASDGARAVAVRDDHADVGGVDSGIVQRRDNRARQAVAVVANREQAGRLGDVAAAQHFAQHPSVARGGGILRLQQQRAGAFAEDAAVARRVEGPQRLRCDQAEAIVVEHHLRLDRRIVPDGDDAVGFAVAQRLHAFDHRQRAAAAVAGDARVAALQAVLDADVPEHVVGQRAQQPHRVHRVGEFAPERRAGCRRPRRAAGNSRTGSRNCRCPSRRRRRCGR